MKNKIKSIALQVLGFIALVIVFTILYLIPKILFNWNEIFVPFTPTP